MPTTAGIAGLSGTAVRRICGRRRFAERHRLSGTFDVNLTWNAEALSPTATSTDSAASIFAAIQEQLGLRLVSITTPIEVIVIDRADRPASN